jgi:hypothetical protein
MKTGILKSQTLFIAELSTGSSPHVEVTLIGDDGHIGGSCRQCCDKCGDRRHASLADERDRKAAEQAAACIASG